MRLQNNILSKNALANVKVNTKKAAKKSEKLSSGFQINRSADNAAGLGISEKMRKTIRGLEQAVNNTNDGINLIQTAEGGLNEVHAVLDRLRELAVQSANGTYSDETDRQALQGEVEALITEINRISESTEFNSMKLLDGSNGGNSDRNDYGPRYGIRQFVDVFNQHVDIASSVADVVIEFTTEASGRGGENAFFDDSGKVLTINLAGGVSYTDDVINNIIKNAKVSKGVEHAPADVEWKTEYGIIKAAAYITEPTVPGMRHQAEVNVTPLLLTNGTDYYADKITFTANQYGSNINSKSLFSLITIVTDVGEGEEHVSIDEPAELGVSGSEISLHLSTGIEYTAKDIELLLKSKGFDYTVEMSDSLHPDGFNTVYFNKKDEVLQELAESSETKTVEGVPSGVVVYKAYQSFNALASYESLLAGTPGLGMGIDYTTSFNYYDGSKTHALSVNLESYILQGDPGKSGTFQNLMNNLLFPSSGNLDKAKAQEFAERIAEALQAAFRDKLSDSSIKINGEYDDASGRVRFVVEPTSSGVTRGFSTGGCSGNLSGNFTHEFLHVNCTPDMASAIGKTEEVSVGVPTNGQGLGKDFYTGAGKGIILQVGPDNLEEHRVGVYIDDMSADALGVSDVNVATRGAANDSIELVDIAIGKVSAQRAKLGATQNRLEKTLNNLTYSGENLTAAESQIRDTDMAKEMIDYTKYQILQQASQAMLAQTSKLPEGVLQLLSA